MKFVKSDMVSESGFSSIPSHRDEGEFVSGEDEDLFQKNVLVPTSSGPSFADNIIEKFSAASEDLSAKRVEYKEKLGKAAETGDPSDVLEATKALGDYNLQVLISTKVASKTTGAIEKITNLQ